MGQSHSKRYNPYIKLLDLTSGQLHLLSALSPTRNSPAPTEYGDGGGPISGLDALYKRKPLALPAIAHRILRCPALIPVSALITQPFSGIKVYAVFWAPIPSDGPCCAKRYMATFYITFFSALGFQIKLLI